MEGEKIDNLQDHNPLMVNNLMFNRLSASAISTHKWISKLAKKKDSGIRNRCA